MSRCLGNVPAGTKIDSDMKAYLRSESNRLGVSESELIRRILDAYRDSQSGETVCHACGAKIAFNVVEG